MVVRGRSTMTCAVSEGVWGTREPRIILEWPKPDLNAPEVLEGDWKQAVAAAKPPQLREFCRGVDQMFPTLVPQEEGGGGGGCPHVPHSESRFLLTSLFHEQS